MTLLLLYKCSAFAASLHRDWYQSVFLQTAPQRYKRAVCRKHWNVNENLDRGIFISINCYYTSKLYIYTSNGSYTTAVCVCQRIPLFLCTSCGVLFFFLTPLSIFFSTKISKREVEGGRGGVGGILSLARPSMSNSFLEKNRCEVWESRPGCLSSSFLAEGGEGGGIKRLSTSGLEVRRGSVCARLMKNHCTVFRFIFFRLGGRGGGGNVSCCFAQLQRRTIYRYIHVCTGTF